MRALKLHVRCGSRGVVNAADVRGSQVDLWHSPRAHRSSGPTSRGSRQSSRQLESDCDRNVFPDADLVAQNSAPAPADETPHSPSAGLLFTRRAAARVRAVRQGTKLRLQSASAASSGCDASANELKGATAENVGSGCVENDDAAPRSDLESRLPGNVLPSRREAPRHPGDDSPSNWNEELLSSRNSSDGKREACAAPSWTLQHPMSPTFLLDAETSGAAHSPGSRNLGSSAEPPAMGSLTAFSGVSTNVAQPQATLTRPKLPGSGDDERTSETRSTLADLDSLLAEVLEPTVPVTVTKARPAHSQHDRDSGVSQSAQPSPTARPRASGEGSRFDGTAQQWHEFHCTHVTQAALCSPISCTSSSNSPELVPLCHPSPPRRPRAPSCSSTDSSVSWGRRPAARFVVPSGSCRSPRVTSSRNATPFQGGVAQTSSENPRRPRRPSNAGDGRSILSPTPPRCPRTPSRATRFNAMVPASPILAKGMDDGAVSTPCGASPRARVRKLLVARSNGSAST